MYNRIDDIKANALLLVIAFLTIKDLLDHRIDSIYSAQFVCITLRGQPAQNPDIQGQTVLDNDAQHGKRGATQGEWILVTTRLFTDGENTDQTIEPIGQGNRLRDR